MNLSSEQEYNFVVSAVNEAGSSRPSLHTKGKTTGVARDLYRCSPTLSLVMEEEEEEEEGEEEEKEGEEEKEKEKGKQHEQQETTKHDSNRWSNMSSSAVEFKDEDEEDEDEDDEDEEDNSNDDDDSCCCCFSRSWCRRTVVKLAHTMETAEGKLDIHADDKELDSGLNSTLNTSLDSTLNEAEEQENWTRVIFHACLSQTGTLVAFLFIFGGTVRGTFFSILMTLSWLLYGSLQNPRPATSYWNWMLVYITTWLTAGFIFQLPFFCLRYVPEDNNFNPIIYPSIQPWCPTSTTSNGYDELKNLKNYMNESDTNWFRLLSPVYKRGITDHTDWWWVDVITLLGELLLNLCFWTP